ncbi:hypothetical protein BD413DRAFT_108111 [Trametes elegans]|nr:hypothetical protein BD413DRAFT_108111 [Trametes elegans]
MQSASLASTHSLLPGQVPASGQDTFRTSSKAHTHLSEHIEDDFEEISYDELRLSLCQADLAHFTALFDYQQSYNQSLLSRSRSSISRLRKLSRPSLKRPRGVLGRTRAKDARSSSERTEDKTPARSFTLSRPSSSDASSRASSSPHTPPPSQPSLFPLGADATRKVQSFKEQSTSEVRIVEESATGPDSLALLPSPTPHSPKAKSFTSSLKRLRTLSKSSLFSARRHASQVCQVELEERSGEPLELSGIPTAEELHQLPELVFEHIDFLSILEDSPATSLVPSSHSADQNPTLPRIEVVQASPHLQLTDLHLPLYELVDPLSLTASAPASAVDRISRFWSAPPSPSWLSRNVDGVEPTTRSSPLPLPIPPPPSPPLYIVPRSLRPDTYYLREPEIEFEFTTAPQTPQSTTSSLTLYNSSQRASFLGPTDPIGVRPTSVNRLSVIYRRSQVDSRQSIHSVVAYSQDQSGEIIRVGA